MLRSNKLTALICGTAFLALSVSPLMAQDTPAPANTPAATTDPASPPAAADTPSTTAPANTQNGPTSGAEAQVKDEDVFGFDISGATQPTAEQMTAARNTCNEKVNTEPTRYSGAVRTFCEQVLKM